MLGSREEAGDATRVGSCSGGAARWGRSGQIHAVLRASPTGYCASSYQNCSNKKVRFQTSTLADAPAISALLSGAAAHVRDAGRGLWSADVVSVAAVSRHADQGQYRLGLMGDELAGVFRLDADDPVFWPEMPPGGALYLHKLAVLPARQGQRLALQPLCSMAPAAHGAFATSEPPCPPASGMVLA